MPTQEEAVNTAVALALREEFALSAAPEKTAPGGKRCDITVRENPDAHNFTAVECKHGQGPVNRRDAVKSAQRWLKYPACWNAVALCYPPEIKTASSVALTPDKLAARADYLMAQVNHNGVQGKWIRGTLGDLARLIKDVDERDMKFVVHTLRDAIELAASFITPQTTKELAEVLQVLYEPGDAGIDRRPALIACLLLTNTVLLHERMQRSGAVPKLAKLAALRKRLNIWAGLLENWEKIRRVDYAPVIDPAIAILETMPNEMRTIDALDTLVAACIEAAPCVRNLRLDHAGPMYHTLLSSAKYDGSFYTSTPASILLAEIAMPPAWLGVDWGDVNRLAGLKICDPACGTGTLLMATARAMQERLTAAGGDKKSLDKLHIHLVENVLYGLDINRHAVHLAASMLTLSAPAVDYNKMNMFQMKNQVEYADKSKHGALDKVRAGSLDLLIDNEQYIPGIVHDTEQMKMSAEGVAMEAPPIKGRCNMVIMNPPYTRNSLRNLHLPDQDRKLIQKHEINIAQSASDGAHRQIIDQTALGSFFIPIADTLLDKDRGTLAMVYPFAFCTAPSQKEARKFLTDPARFHLELVITSHDNRRIYFSDSTNIHECLIVARRIGYYASPPTHTHFVSLAENPSTANGARQLAKAILAALDGNHEPLGEYGHIVAVKTESLRERAWNEACFYDPSLTQYYEALNANKALSPLRDVAEVGPAGQAVRGALARVKQRQYPDIRALWDHKTERQTRMRTSPDSFVIGKKGNLEYAKSLWARRSHLLIAARSWLNLNRTFAVYSEMEIIGSAFVPVRPNTGDGEYEKFCKAWCVWLNSTPGMLSFLNIRQKKLTYPSFSMDSLRTLPVPHPDRCDIDHLAQTFDEYADQKLKSFPEICDDTVRHKLDEAVAKAVPGIDIETMEKCRRAISQEPSVTNAKESPLA